MTAIEKKKENPIVPLLRSQGHAISEALRGSPVTQEAFETALRSDVAANPELAQCIKENPASVMTCIMQAAQLGLRPGPTHQHFHLIPRKMKDGMRCTSVVGFRGLIDMAMRSGKIEHIDAQCVYRGEKFEYDRGTGQISHAFDLEDTIERSPKTLIAAYAICKVKGRDRLTTIVLRRDDIEKRKESSQGAKSTYSPWSTHYEAMCKKTAMRALLNSGLIPLGDMAERVKRASVEEDETETVVQAEWSEPQTRAKPDTIALATDALHDDPFPGELHDLLEELAKLEDNLGVEANVVADYCTRTYGEIPNVLPPALVARLIRDLREGKVTA